MNKVINAQTIVAGGSFTSNTIDLTGWPKTANTKIGITAIVTGTGTAKLEYLVPTTQLDNSSVDGLGNFMEPSGVSDVGSGLSSGSYTAEFTPISCDAMRFKVTETGGVNPVVVTIYVVVK